MRITDLLQKEGILLDGHPTDKAQAIEMLADLMNGTGVLKDRDAYRDGLCKREAEGTTGIGEGVAIPHAKTDAVKQAQLVAMVVPEGVDYESLDGEPTRLFFAIAAPMDAMNLHLDLLGNLSVLMMDEEFRESLLHCSTPEEFLQRIDQAEQEKFGQDAQEEKQQQAQQQAQEGYRVLAVTACPTGIAHTYMAAEKLEEVGKAMGISIKVETNGSGGAKNVLTPEEIAACECIIVAADKQVEMARFHGKRVIQVKVADGIHKAQQLLEEAVSGQVPVYQHSGAVTEAAAPEKVSLGRQVYMHLMNGISHMLPFVIGGGILIALAFLLDDPSIDYANYGMNTPVAAFFKTVGDAAFGFMLPVLAGFIAMSIADRPGLAVGFVGGYLANSGGSGFLGALLAGFIAGYLMVGLRKLFDKLPRSLEGTKPVLLYPFFGVLLIGAIILLVVNPPVAALNNAIIAGLQSMGTSSKVVLGLIVGGMMSVDMGGPVNKAAYAFGIASLSMGEYDIMAAVMVGGMVPPLAIALCMTFFKNRFTPRKRQTTVTNYIMGLSFISEGAIPFAAADPLRVLPSCIVGSAVAGALSMAFGCSIMAPHGGMWVISVITNPLQYVAALVIGSVVGMLLLAVLKKPVEQNND
ncbi:MAG: PTS fructose transporter subunit IIABC [Eubacteriales bacterium]|jgi:PTS system fructose-specific IIC component